MHARRALATLVVVSVASLAPPARAITNGADDAGDPEVAALLDADGNTVCTGTLVAPDAVLTAAHCFDESPPAGVYFGATPPALGLVVDVASVEQHPNYDSATHAHDIGIVRLASRPPIAAARMYAMPLSASFVGQTIRIVGFGRTSTLDDTAPQKRTGDSRVEAAADGRFTFRPAPSQTCFGDSGGPAFAVVGGVEQLVGVTSTGDLGCNSGATDVVVQSFDSGFVAGYLAGAASQPGVEGGCAFAGAPAGGGASWPLCALVMLAGYRGVSHQRRRRGAATRRPPSIACTVERANSGSSTGS